jgi:hypothetical protein
MIEKSLITRAEREVFLRYDRQRRVQMLRIVTPAFLVLTGSGFSPPQGAGCEPRR